MMQLKSTATVFEPHTGRTFSFLGNTITLQSNADDRGGCMFELLAPADGGSPPLHTHPWDEIVYLLEGEMEIQLDDQMMHIASGSAFHLPAGVAHTFRSTSPQARFFVWVSNATATNYLQELADESDRRSLTPTEVMAIAQKYHIRAVVDQ